MALRTIVTMPEPVLRRKAKAVAKFDGSLQKLIDDMIETMRAAPGVGLAAPQVGVSERVIVVEYFEHEEDAEKEENEQPPKKLFAMVNPEITRQSSEILLGTEGCLSIPGLLGDVDRFEAVTVKGKNRHGQPLTVKAKGWLARIFQHEIDHLNGVVFTDRAEKVWKAEGPVEDRV
jgi:peptide deformylase